MPARRPQARTPCAGSGSAGIFTPFEIDVQSGPGGENPTGHVTGDGLIDGDVTCLAVSGNRATIGVDSQVPGLATFTIVEVIDNVGGRNLPAGN